MGEYCQDRRSFMTIYVLKWPSELMKDCSVNYGDTRDFDHAVSIVEAHHLNQRDRWKVFTEHFAIRPTQRVLVVNVGLQVCDIDRQYSILVGTSPRRFYCRL